jgi:hypothetical protein
VVFSRIAYELFNRFTVKNAKSNSLRPQTAGPQNPLGDKSSWEWKAARSLVVAQDWLRTQDPAHPEVAWARVFIATCKTVPLTY